MLGTSSRTMRIAGVTLGILLLSLTILPAQTTQNFQTIGTQYTSTQIGTTNPPVVMGGGPAGANFLRLLTTVGNAGTNTIAFQRTDPGAFNQIVADFDFRMNPGTGQGEGMGFALLNTVTYDRFGGVAGPAEEPNFTGSLGIGFDNHANGGEINGNHVSVHFNNAKIAEVDAGSIALAGNQWIHAHIVVRPGSGFSDVSVTLTPSSTGVPGNLITNQAVSGLQPYESRVYFAARSTASQTADHDLANVQVTYTSDPALFGKWGGVLPLPIVPIHSTLLPTGKIICWDRAEANTDTTPRLIDAATLDIPASNVSLTTAAHPGFEIFCSGHTVTADGKLFVAGGHKVTDGNGLDTTFTYDGVTNVWTRLQDMGTVGRWYPSVCKLANGNIVVMAGNKTEATGANSAIQLMTFNGVGSGTWSTLTGATRTMMCFPMLHLAPNGKLFQAGPEKTGGFLDPSGTGSWSFINSIKGTRDYGNSVLYDTGKVLLVGGGNFEAGGRPTSSAEVIDITAPSPAWRLVGSMAYQRRQCNSLLLPDGTVLVTGGTSSGGFSDPAGSVLPAELWDPTTETFRMLAGMSVDRSYHSETILLPDGRVLSQGSGHGGGPLPEFNAEVYSPPYLFKGARPALSGVPSRVIYGAGFSVTSVDAADVTGVSLIAVTSVTHATNYNQRIVRPAFTAGVNQINITAPSDPNICPPGPYLLFLLNSAGVPSEGKFILVNHNQPPVASTGGAITAEAANSSGASVQFNGTTSTDIDNNITTYEWYEGTTLLATGSTPNVTLTPGVHTITLKVIDAQSLSGTTTFTVKIEDTTAPVIQTLTAAPNLLRSVTNQLVAVTLTAGVADTVDPAPTAKALSVVSTEATSGLFSGDQPTDWELVGGLTVNVRAERYAILRRYTISAGATDASGNASTQKTVDVKVRGKWFP